jgi:MFS transporter, SHS family, sialic acid transporter
MSPVETTIKSRVEVSSQSAVLSPKGRWLALTAALLGWMFDGAEMGVFSLVGRSALLDLFVSTKQGNAESEVGLWFGIITAAFLVGAATGGVLFGWLGDRIGRVRAMTLSVLTYALFTGACGLATTPAQFGVMRFIAALGMGGEWSLGVALVMEVWPNRSRAFMAGLIGAAANVGYLLVAIVGIGLAAFLASLTQLLSSTGLPQTTVDYLTANQGWRIMMLLGTAPALLTFLIRLFVPESERWLHEKQRGSTSSWANRDLVGVLVGALGPAVIIYLWAQPHPVGLRLIGSLFGITLATVGYMYPARRFLQREEAKTTGSSALAPHALRRMLLGAGLSGIALLGTWGAAQWAPTWADKLTHSDPAQGAKYYTQIASALGAVVGTIIAALMGDWFGRRLTYTLLCVVSFISLLLFYQGNTEYGAQFLACTFLMGGCTASFYGWLPLYLPELFSTSMRATGQGFCFNFGRILAAIGTLQTANLFQPISFEYFRDTAIGSAVRSVLLVPPDAGWVIPGGYPFACSVMSMIYFLGVILIWFAPETRGKPLPE